MEFADRSDYIRPTFVDVPQQVIEDVDEAGAVTTVAKEPEPPVVDGVARCEAR